MERRAISLRLLNQCAFELFQRAIVVPPHTGAGPDLGLHALQIGVYVWVYV